jgi:hypothetical protein
MISHKLARLIIHRTIMTNANLLDNIVRLRSWNINYLRERLIEWKVRNLPTKPDDFGCIIAKTVSSNGYAKITLSKGSKQKRDQWHVNAYTLMAFIENRLPSDKDLSIVKHPIASHLCGRGANGCCNLDHIVFGESQKINIDRLNKRCNLIIECTMCKVEQIVNPCQGHGENALLCIAKKVNTNNNNDSNKRARLEQIDKQITKLQDERKQILLSTAMLVRFFTYSRLFPKDFPRGPTIS